MSDQHADMDQWFLDLLAWQAAVERADAAEVVRGRLDDVLDSLATLVIDPDADQFLAIESMLFSWPLSWPADAAELLELPGPPVLPTDRTVTVDELASYTGDLVAWAESCLAAIDPPADTPPP